MRISVHNKSPELFTVKLESPSRQRVKHSALEQKFPDRYARRRRFNSPSLHGFLFFAPFFLSFLHLQFSYPSFLKIFSPTSNLNLWIFHGCLPESMYMGKKSVIKDHDGGGGGGEWH